MDFIISSARLCENCHFDASGEILSFDVGGNARSLTAFEMTSQPDDELSHSLAGATDVAFSATCEEKISPSWLEMTIETHSYGESAYLHECSSIDRLLEPLIMTVEGSHLFSCGSGPEIFRE